MDKEAELAIVRKAYSRQILAAAGVRDPAVEAAFAQVPREHYLGRGPWMTFKTPVLQSRPAGAGPPPDAYAATPDDDPVFLYTDALFGLLTQRGINNGQPSLHAILLSAAAIQPGEHVVHVGAGTGYYSAILARLVGPNGRVTAIEFDDELAERLERNVSAEPNITPVHGDAGKNSLDAADVVYANASFARIPDTWLDALRDGGRILVPMSYRLPPGFPGAAQPQDLAKMGRALASACAFRIERRGVDYHVKWICPAAFIAAEGMDTESVAALARALEKGTARNVTRLYCRDDIPDDQCWLRGKGWCLAYN
ncbi:MAG TPA: methyltransferase domain-containing protein [Steroidobacteraceae bacterium]|jgi:protein-L-isoaspartate(D-aspartate) O-methyltransferase